MVYFKIELLMQQIYDDLAWGGLEDTPQYNSLSQTDKNRIQARIHVENNNIPRTANSVTYNPVGQICN